jgi:hypothetical protein
MQFQTIFSPLIKKEIIKGLYVTSNLAIAQADEPENQNNSSLHRISYGDQPNMFTEIPIYLTLKIAKA